MWGGPANRLAVLVVEEGLWERCLETREIDGGVVEN